jgi:beta-lactamase class A
MRNCFTFCLLALSLRAADLEAELKKRIAAGPGQVFLAARNLKTGAAISLRGEEKVRTASTIKLPLLVEVYAQVAAGKAKLDETLLMRRQDIVSGSGVLRELGPNVKLPLAGVANLMIVVSDNTATNMLIERFTADAVNARMDALGLPATRLMRKVRGDGNQLKAAEGFSQAGLREENKKFGLGSSTPLEMVRLLEILHQDKTPGSKQMLEILKRQQYNDGIGRRIGDLTVANKTGSLDHLRSDVGIVYAPSGPVAIAITVEDIPDIDYGEDNPGLLLIADLARILVDHLGR